MSETINVLTKKGNRIGELRIKFGDEIDDWGDVSCGDCGVLKGQYHLPNCDVERCPVCDGQVISCDCDWENYEEIPVKERIKQ